MTKFKDYLGGLSVGQIFFIFAISIFLIYLTAVTSKVPVYINEAGQIVDNETNIVLYEKDSTVPKSNVNSSHLLVAFLLFAGLIMGFLSKEAKKPEMADIDEVNEIMKNYLKKRESIETKQGHIITLGNFTISNNFILRDELKGNERKPYKYVLQINITDLEKRPHYVKGYVHPYTRHVSGFMDIDQPLEEKDQCDICGKEYDIKYIDTEDYRTFKKIKDDLDK